MIRSSILMAYGPPIFHVLVFLGGRLIDAQAPIAGAPSVGALDMSLDKALKAGAAVVSSCVPRNSACMAGWNVAQGNGNVAQCEAFKIYDNCYRTNIQLCKKESGTSSSSGSISGGDTEFSAEAAQFHTEYERIIAILPRGCHVSIAPKDSSGSEASGSSDIVMPTSVSSYASMPKSMRTRPVGSWSVYMTWWQWILFACCCCCFCAGGGGGAAMFGKRRNEGGRKQGRRGSYDDQAQWAQPQPMYTPQHQDPQQAYPLMPQQQSYAMPQQQSYAMPQQQSYAMPQQGAYAQTQGQFAFAQGQGNPINAYSAAMPTQYNMGTQRMY